MNRHQAHSVQQQSRVTSVTSSLEPLKGTVTIDYYRSFCMAWYSYARLQSRLECLVPTSGEVHTHRDGMCYCWSQRRRRRQRRVTSHSVETNTRGGRKGRWPYKETTTSPSLVVSISPCPLSTRQSHVSMIPFPEICKCPVVSTFPLPLPTQRLQVSMIPCPGICK
jgi:hypothetical protein